MQEQRLLEGQVAARAPSSASARLFEITQSDGRDGRARTLCIDKGFKDIFDRNIAAQAIMGRNSCGAIKPGTKLKLTRRNDVSWRRLDVESAKQTGIDSDIRFIAFGIGMALLLAADGAMREVARKPLTF